MMVSSKIALTYFLLSNVIFIAGVHRVIDETFWAILSFIIYWPFSHVTGKIWQFIVGEQSSIDNTHAFLLGLTRDQCLIYSLDVLVGTVWWWTLSLSVSKVLARIRSNSNPNQGDSYP
jgi:hypothetical protein